MHDFLTAVYFLADLPRLFSSDAYVSFCSSIWSASCASLPFWLMVKKQLFKTLVREWQGRFYPRESHQGRRIPIPAVGSCGRGERLDSTMTTTRRSGNRQPRSKEEARGWKVTRRKDPWKAGFWVTDRILAEGRSG